METARKPAECADVRVAIRVLLVPRSRVSILATTAVRAIPPLANALVLAISLGMTAPSNLALHCPIATQEERATQSKEGALVGRVLRVRTAAESSVLVLALEMDFVTTLRELAPATLCSWALIAA